MTTVATCCQRTRFMLFGSQRDRINFLAEDHVPLDGPEDISLELDPSGSVGVGDYVEINFESMLVTAISARTLTVWRGIDGFSQTLTAGDLVRIRPIVTDYQLFTYMEDELRDLSAPQNGLYQVKQADLTITSNTIGYDLGLADATKLIKARSADTTSEWFRTEGVRMEREMGDFASGVAIFVPKVTGRTLRVWVRAPFGSIGLDGDVEDSGLADTASDLLSIGAAYRTMIGREAARSLFETQGDTRRADEVPPGAQRQGLTPFVALRAQRIAAEKTRLDTLWPIEKT